MVEIGTPASDPVHDIHRSDCTEPIWTTFHRTGVQKFVAWNDCINTESLITRLDEGGNWLGDELVGLSKLEAVDGNCR